jgi:hypothetical protein
MEMMMSNTIRSRRWLGWLLAVLAVVFFVAGPMCGNAWAKKKRESVRGKGRITVDKYGSADVSDDSGGGGDSTDLGVAEIEGRIFKPAVFFVLARSDIQYQALRFKQNFVNRIVLGALKRPF